MPPVVHPVHVQKQEQKVSNKQSIKHILVILREKKHNEIFAPYVGNVPFKVMDDWMYDC